MSEIPPYGRRGQMPLSESLDRCDMLRGRENRLIERFKELRNRIHDMIPNISIDDIGVMQENSSYLPRIKPELIDHAMQVEEWGKELLKVQDELTETSRDLMKARETYYAEAGKLV